MSQTTKTLHPRNAHNNRYDFPLLCKSFPKLKPFVAKNKYGDLSIDFSNDEAVLALNKALLIYYYQLHSWDLPKNYLCPPIPGRADYIHYLADLLQASNNNKTLTTKEIKGIDIGIGANGIYALLCSKIYNWKMLGSDISEVSLQNVQKIIEQDDLLKDSITLKHQQSAHDIFTHLIQKEDKYTFSLCNPPFHKSQKEAQQGSLRKVRNLNKNQQAKLKLNFGGQSNELWCNGGELLFIKKMIQQSKEYASNILWFTTLVSKGENLKDIYKYLDKAHVKEVQTIEMKQGQKTSRFVAWTYFDKVAQQQWFKELKDTNA